MKKKPITKKELIVRGLTDKAKLYIAALAISSFAETEDRMVNPSLLGNPVADTSKDLETIP